MRRLHGVFAALGLAPLAYGWATVSVPHLAAIALGCLALAAAGGIVTARVRRWRIPLSTEALAFGHLSVAALGYLLLLGAVLGAGAP